MNIEERLKVWGDIDYNSMHVSHVGIMCTCPSCDGKFDRTDVNHLAEGSTIRRFRFMITCYHCDHKIEIITAISPDDVISKKTNMSIRTEKRICAVVNGTYRDRFLRIFLYLHV